MSLNQGPQFIELQEENDFHNNEPHHHHNQSLMSKSHIHMPDENYNPLAMPPDWEFAKQHAMARRTAKEIPVKQGQMQKVCPCCGYELDRQDIGMCDPALELAFLGSGYPLFYNYIKYSILLLASLAIFESIPNLYLYQQGTFCNSTQLQAAQQLKKQEEDPKQDFVTPCIKFELLTMSMANIINHQFPSYQIYLQIAVQFLVMVELMVFRYHQRKIDIDVDKQLLTPADYSIIVKNIPQGMTGYQIEKELRDKISLHAIYGKQIEVKKVVPVYKIHELEEKEEEIKEQIKHKQSVLLANNSQYHDPEVHKIDHKIEELEHELEQVKEKIMHDPKAFAGIAFVSFNTEQEKLQVIEGNQISEFQRLKLYFSRGSSKKYLKNKRGRDVLYWKDRHIFIEQAPEPNDIDWEFIHETTNNRLWARLKSNFHQFILMVICFATIYLISYGQSLQIDKAMEAVMNNEEGADLKYFMVRLISVVISAIIVIINKFWLGGQVHHIVDHEKWSTKTKLNISFATKLTLALFCNTALITLAVEIVTFNNYYGVGGMITTESMVFVFNAIVPPLAWLVDPWHLAKNSKRNKEVQKGSKSVLTQQEANELCEMTEYINGKRYADMMKTMWFTFFYCPIVPFGTFCSIFGLLIYYWIDKYNVIKRRTIKEAISKDLTFQMIELLEFIVIFHAFGNIMFKSALFGFFERNDILILIAALVYNLSPLQSINECIFPIPNQEETARYEEAVHDFDTDYDRENPVYKKQALKIWIEGRAKKGEQNQ